MRTKKIILVLLITTFLILLRSGHSFVTDLGFPLTLANFGFSEWDSREELPPVQTLNSAIFLLVLNHLHNDQIFISRSELRVIVSSVLECSRRYSIEPELIFSLIHRESSFRSKAVSNKGAIGLMQILPSTARPLAEELDIQWRDKNILFDPTTNIEIGTYYLYKLLNDFEDLDTALSAFNMGPTKVQEAKGEVPSFRTSFSAGVMKGQENLAIP